MILRGPGWTPRESGRDWRHVVSLQLIQSRAKLNQLEGTGQIDEYALDKEQIADEVCYRIKKSTRNERRAYPDALDQFEAVLHGLADALSE